MQFDREKASQVVDKEKDSVINKNPLRCEKPQGNGFFCVDNKNVRAWWFSIRQ